MDLRAYKLPKPFCKPEQAAYFLDLSYNQVTQMNGKLRHLPLVRTAAGEVWAPGGSKLIDCGRLYEMLDEQGRELFWLWQRDDLVLKPLGRTHGRDVPVRQLHAKVGG